MINDVIDSAYPHSQKLLRNMVGVITSGSKAERTSAVVGSLTVCAGLGVLVVSASSTNGELVFLGFGIMVLGYCLMLWPLMVRQLRRETERDQKLSNLEEMSRKEEAPPRLAWDVAKIKLESYLDRNLTQVSAIFTLVALAMACGMILVGIGVWRSITAPDLLAPAAVAAISGIVVQAIAGTFLVIYRSTMEQANSYVVVLERINAVGMSLNILETLEGANAATRNAAKVDIARDLLNMYGIKSKRIQRETGAGIPSRRERRSTSQLSKPT